MLLLHDGRVENDVVAQFLLSPPHVVGHTFEHLEAEAVLGRLVHLAQQVGVRDGEEVVGSHTDVQHAGILRLQATLDDVQVVGIHLRLVGAHGIGPSAQVAHNVLHIQVATLHDAHLDGGTAFFHTLAGKLEELALEPFGIGQIGLHDDTCLVVLELRKGKDILEEFHGQMGILVLLHIEVDELGFGHTVHIGIGIIDGRLVELRHAADKLREALLIVQGMRLRIDAGDLDGDVVDVWLLQGLQVRLVALVGLPVAQNHFTQQVDVLPDVLMETGGKMLRQAGTGSIDDDTAGIAAKTPLDDGHSHPIEDRKVGKLLVHPEKSVIEAVEELRDAVLVDEFLHTDCQLLAVTDLTGLVKHAHDELLVTGGGDHCAIHMLLALLQLGQSGVALVVKLAHP